MSREVLQMALEALMYASYEDIEYDATCATKVLTARNAIKEALAQPEQEPVGVIGIPTTEDYAMGYAEGFNDACKPKAQPEQKPVAWMHTQLSDVAITHRPADLERHPDRWIALYTSPPQRQPLTPEQLPPIPSAYRDGVYLGYSQSDFKDYARAIEAAYGIGDKT